MNKMISFSNSKQLHEMRMSYPQLNSNKQLVFIEKNAVIPVPVNHTTKLKAIVLHEAKNELMNLTTLLFKVPKFQPHYFFLGAGEPHWSSPVQNKLLKTKICRKNMVFTFYTASNKPTICTMVACTVVPLGERFTCMFH